MNGRHHLNQLRKNWGIITMILTVVFGAGVLWSFTERDFVEAQTFATHVDAEKEALTVHKETDKREMDQRFEAQMTLIDTKFENTDSNIEDLKGEVGETQETLEEIKDYLMDR